MTHRQRPATANQVTFLNLEDETGMVNIICPARVWARNRKVAQNASALLVYGTVERVQGVTNILAKRIRLLRMTVRSMSRDFR